MIFLSDLDRTLIFSYKRLSKENICVEEKEGKKLSYMTPYSAELFGKAVKMCTFIPITTRSAEQYGRIKFPGEYNPEYAVIDNGANLLCSGMPDKDYSSAYTAGFERAAPEMRRMKEMLEADSRVYFEIRIVDGAFLFTKCHDSEEVLRELQKKLRPAECGLFTNGDKLYGVPKSISKENALKALRKRFKGEKIIAAGDSLFDEGMLRAADIAVIKSGELTGRQLNSCQYSEEGDDPDFVLKTVTEILQRGSY